MLKRVMTMWVAVAVALLLALPGYCDWWPIEVQAASVGAGVVGLFGGAAVLAWKLWGDTEEEG